MYLFLTVYAVRIKHNMTKVEYFQSSIICLHGVLNRQIRYTAAVEDSIYRLYCKNQDEPDEL